jgi:hypothetical protein
MGRTLGHTMGHTMGHTRGHTTLLGSKITLKPLRSEEANRDLLISFQVRGPHFWVTVWVTLWVTLRVTLWVTQMG